MSADLDDLQLEPELTAEEFAMELDPLPVVATPTTVPPQGGNLSPAPAALMQVLPADFPLPSLIKFCPDPALRAAADEAARYALAIEVAGPEGLQRADVALTALRTSLKAIEVSFDEPKDIANRLHKQITGTLSAWCAPGKAALDTVGGRVAREQRRLKAEADERRRRDQEEEDRKARERAREEARAAEAAKAPAPVVQEMKRQAETVTAPPVPDLAPAPKLTGSNVVTTWKARVKGTPAFDDPNPAIEAMSVQQKAKVMDLLRAIVDAELPLVGIQIDWSYWNKRAKADKNTLDLPGIEAFPDEGLRAKATRSRV